MPKKEFSQVEKDLARQPLSSDGWSDDRFDELYTKDKNPHLNTERNRLNRKGDSRISIPNLPKTDQCQICGKSKFQYQEICGECFVCVYGKSKRKTNSTQRSKLGK